MGYAALAFIVVFLLAGSALLLLFYRQPLGTTLENVLSHDPRAGYRKARQWSGFVDRAWILERAEALGALVGSIHGLKDQSGAKSEPLAQRLAFAGYRNERVRNIFFLSKLLAPAALCLICVVSGIYRWYPFVAIVVSLGIGYLLPDYWLDHRIKVRREALQFGLPDLLDLVVVCLEAGLSLDQACMRSSEEIHHSHPVVADEISLVMLEVQAGRPRLDAWRRLAVRTGVDIVSMVVSVIVQADQFGTPISTSLRTFSDSLRARRRHKIEELTAKTSVKLVFPLVLLIFPAFFIVILGPVVIALVGYLSHY